MINQNVKDTIASLREQPNDWKPYYIGPKPYRIEHKTKPLAIWVANGIPGMGLQYRGLDFWGGVTFCSTFMLSPSHIALWWASREWLRDSRPPEYRNPTVEDILA